MKGSLDQCRVADIPGASVIITYFAADFLDWLDEERQY
jgi:hypothetical protein